MQTTTISPSKESSETSKSVLEPYERISEALFGLIMVLTFTGSLSIAQSGRAEVRSMLIGALGCNLAWGIIDAILYLMGCLTDRGRDIRALRALRKAVTPEEAHSVIAAALPPMVATSLSAAEYESLKQKLLQFPEPPLRPWLSKQELLGALYVFLWVFLVTFPVAIPFILMDNIGPAMRVSNAVAVVMLFLAGHAFGRVTEYWPWLMGLGMVLLGSTLVAMTMALGG